MAEATEVVHEDLSKRFQTELEWKDTLESKALSYLGFVGISLTLLFAVLTDNPSDRGPNSDLAIFPALLLVTSALVLMVSVFGTSIHAGPNPLQVFRARAEDEKAVRTGLARAYGYSLLANRLRFFRARFAYQLAILISAAAIVQLGFDLASVGLDPQRAAPYAWPQVSWLPGILVTGLSLLVLARRDVPMLRDLREEFKNWNAHVDE